MMKTKINILLAAILIVSTSCNDWLETTPEQSLSDDLAFSTPQTARAVLLGGYTGLYAQAYYGRDMIIAPELLSDNIKIALSNSGRLSAESTNDERAHIGDAGFWTACYAVINRVNLVLANIDGVAGMSDAEKEQLKGEAYFLRALVYFDLTRTYGRNPNFLIDNFDLGVPLLLQPFDGLDEDAFPARATIDQVYDQIKADLNEAMDLLDNSKAPFYASQVAAKALLARVHLYLQEWQDAVDMSTEAITESGLSLETDDYLNIFTDDTEAIFSIRITINESLGNNNSIAVLYVETPEGVGYGDAVVRQNFLDALEPGDTRADLLEAANHNGEAVTYNLKFNSYGGSVGEDNIPVIRLSELYLIRAEAYAELGGAANELAAQNDLNAIRDRANLPDINSTGATLIQDILDERRVELAFEGHRFFDLKRRGLDIPKGNPVDDCVICTIQYEDYRVVAAIAQAELDVNPNLVNNPGYSDN